MTTPTFSPPIKPIIGGAKKSMYAVRQATFGDGHVQRAADGINNIRYTYDLTWIGSVANIDTIASFLDARAGWQAFFYTVSGDISRKFIARAYNRIYSHGKADTLSVTFEEVMDP